MNGNLAFKNSNICVAYKGKGCSLQPYGISTIHGGHVGEGREHDYREIGGRMKWEPESRSGSFAYRDVGEGREQERKLRLQDVGEGREQERKLRLQGCR